MTRFEYLKALVEVNRLARLDPAPTSYNGIELDRLSRKIDDYERSVFPFEIPTSKELDDFHAAQAKGNDD
jgi:hypothetical protein